MTRPALAIPRSTAVFRKEGHPPVVPWCWSSGHARKPSAKETPAAPLSGARWKASSQADRHRPGHAADAQGSPCPDQTQPDGRSPARGRAGGVQPSRTPGVCHRPDSHGQRERTPAAPSTRRSVEPVGTPAVPGAKLFRRRQVVELDRRSPAQGRAGGAPLAVQVTSSDAGHDQVPGGRGSRCTDRYHLRPGAELVQVVRPRLQHRPALL